MDQGVLQVTSDGGSEALQPRGEIASQHLKVASSKAHPTVSASADPALLLALQRPAAPWGALWGNVSKRMQKSPEASQLQIGGLKPIFGSDDDFTGVGNDAVKGLGAEDTERTTSGRRRAQCW